MGIPTAIGILPCVFASVLAARAARGIWGRRGPADDDELPLSNASSGSLGEMADPGAAAVTSRDASTVLLSTKGARTPLSVATRARAAPRPGPS